MAMVAVCYGVSNSLSSSASSCFTAGTLARSGSGTAWIKRARIERCCSLETHHHRGPANVSELSVERSAVLFKSRRTLPFSALLVLSAAAALAFIRRKQGNQQSRIRQHMASKDDNVVLQSKRIDGHLHVWASAEEVHQYPYFPGQEPTARGNIDYLLQCMEAADIDGAFIVQPINHKFDHSYVSSVLQDFPDKFVGCCLADPTEGGGGLVELDRLIAQEGYRAVRFNPYLWPSDQKMTNEVGKAMFARAGELGAVVSFMCFQGLLLHVEEIEELCSEFPTTIVLIDHFGFCKSPLNSSEREAWDRLLKLALYPQVHVKISAFFRVSREAFPYEDTWPLVRQLLDAYGAKRLMWGSDFPYVIDECGYSRACKELPVLISTKLGLSKHEVGDILGGTALTMFKGTWGVHQLSVLPA